MKTIENSFARAALVSGLAACLACSGGADAPGTAAGSTGGTSGETASSGSGGSTGGSQGSETSGAGGNLTTSAGAVGGSGGDTGGTSTEGTGSGGSDAATGGTTTTGAGGDAGSGGAATGGSGGGVSDPNGAAWGSSSLPIEDVPASDASFCTPPCSLGLIDNGDLAWPDSLSAALYIDFDLPSATLYQDMSLADADLFAMGFTYEDNQYGYSAYFSTPMTDIFALNLEYTANLDSDYEYSMWQDEIITFEIASYSEHKMALVSFSFGDELVRIHEVKIPTCGTSANEGACTNAADCPLVDAGEGSQSAECGGCYDGIAACTEANCADDCAEDLAGNGCLRCQTDAGCHLEFMACSGLDFVPWNSLEFAEW